MLMRDPFLTRGKDGTWHLIWTWGWDRKETGGNLKIGYSSSKDLLNWSPRKEIRVFQNEPTAKRLGSGSRMGRRQGRVDHLLVHHSPPHWRGLRSPSVCDEDT